MIVRGIAIAFMLLGHSALAQPTVAMRKAIRTIQQDLERYDTLSPFGDAPGTYDTIAAIGSRIMGRLQALLNDPRSVTIDLEQEFRDRIGLSVSPDERLAHFNLDERTGGTFRSQHTLLYVRSEGNVWAGEPTTLDAETNEGSALVGGTVDINALGIGGWDSIVRLDDSTYFTIARVTTCSTCCAYSAIGVRLHGTKVRFLSVHDYEGRFYDVERFELDPPTAIFHYLYSDEWTGEAPPAPYERTWYSGTVRYVHGRFITTEACETRRP